MARPTWHPGAETALAFVFGAAWFALSALLMNWLQPSHPTEAAGLAVALDVAVVLSFARYGGIGDAITVGVAGVVALDWYAIPPVHTTLVPNAQNAAALLAYLITGTFLGQLALAARRRAEVSEHEVQLLADEQVALRRVATLVASGASPDEVFAMITSEVGRLLSVDVTALLRYESDKTATVVATWSRGGRHTLPLGYRTDSSGDSLSAAVLSTGRPSRLDSYDDGRGDFATKLRGLGVRSSAGSPVMVGGQVWGVMIGASMSHSPLLSASGSVAPPDRHMTVG